MEEGMEHKGREVALTLEDVELAIKVINTFLREMRKAEMTLRRLAAYTGARRHVSDRDRFIDYVLSQIKAQKGMRSEEEEAVEPELTEEDLERFRKIAEKYKKRR